MVLGTIGIIVVAVVSYQVGLYVDRQRCRAIVQSWGATYMSDKEIRTAIRRYHEAEGKNDEDDDDEDDWEEDWESDDVEPSDYDER